MNRTPRRRDRSGGPALMDKVAYAVHTRSCTFLLDANGLCHWIVSRTGVLPTEVRGCVGAQFVACLHPELDGSLAGELVIGAAALFVKQDEEGAFALMRSGVILHVEQRGAARQSVADGVLSDDTLDLKGPPMSAVPPPPSGYPNSRGGDTMPPPVQLPAPLEMEELDIEPDPSAPQLRPVDHESTVTLTLPLFRPDAPRRV